MNAIRSGWVEDRQFYWSLALIFMIGIAYTMLPAGFDWASESDDDSAATSGSLLRKVQWLPLFMIAGVVLMYRFNLAMLLIRRVNPFLWMFLGWACLSIVWSDQPGVTLRKGVQLIGVVVMALAFCCASWTPRRYQQVQLPVLMFLVLVSYPFTLAFPDWAIHSGLGVEGKWKGITHHKNTLGMAAALAMIIFVHAWAARDMGLRKALLGSGICLFTMLLAQSATAFGVAGMGCMIVVGVLRSPVAYQGRLMAWSLRLLLFIGVPYFLVSVFWGIPTIEDMAAPVADLFGKDLTFSRRTDIWAMVLGDLGDHLIQGTGYGAYWLGEGTRVDFIINELHWTPWQAHNAYIDILNETGVVGFSLVMGFLIFHGWQLGRVARFDPSSFALHLSFFVFLVASNLFESTMFRTITMEYLISMLSSVTLSRVLLEQQFQQQHAAATNNVSPMGMPGHA